MAVLPQFSRSDQQAEPDAREAEVEDAAEYRGGVSYPQTVPDASAGSASSGRSGNGSSRVPFGHATSTLPL